MTEEQIQNPESGENEPETFSREYVTELRQEAAEQRVKAKQADTYRDAYRSAVVAEVCRDLLAEAIGWDDSYDGEDGMPDREKIREAAEALASEKPHLARISQPLPLGPQGEDTAPVDLAAILRSGA